MQAGVFHLAAWACVVLIRDAVCPRGAVGTGGTFKVHRLVRSASKSEREQLDKDPSVLLMKQGEDDVPSAFYEMCGAEVKSIPMLSIVFHFDKTIKEKTATKVAAESCAYYFYCTTKLSSVITADTCTGSSASSTEKKKCREFDCRAMTYSTGSPILVAMVGDHLDDSCKEFYEVVSTVLYFEKCHNVQFDHPLILKFNTSEKAVARIATSGIHVPYSVTFVDPSKPKQKSRLVKWGVCAFPLPNSMTNPLDYWPQDQIKHQRAPSRSSSFKNTAPAVPLEDSPKCQTQDGLKFTYAAAVMSTNTANDNIIVASTNATPSANDKTIVASANVHPRVASPRLVPAPTCRGAQPIHAVKRASSARESGNRVFRFINRNKRSY